MEYDGPASAVHMGQTRSLVTTREIQLMASLKRSIAETEQAKELAKVTQGQLAVVIHDLRTPVMVLRMCVTLLSVSLPATQRVHLDRPARAADLVASMIEELLPAGAGGSKLLAWRSPISSNSLLVDAADVVRLFAEKAGMD
jgi:signal transduction histidine kinase